jgi:hypothetical protein
MIPRMPIESEMGKSKMATPLILKSAAWLVFAGFFTMLAIRQHQFVDRYAVSVCFWDQWDFYAPFAGDTLWHDFDHQQGPHRMGIGLLLGRALARYSQFNTRWDAFAVSFLLMGAATLAVPLARLCGIKSPLMLLAIPPLFLNRSQFEQFICGAAVSVAAMPLLLFMLFCLSLFIRSNALRLTAMALLSFVLIFTGYGLFAGVVATVLLAIDITYQVRTANLKRALPSATALLFNLATFWPFFCNYRIDVATAGTRLSGPRLIDYINCLAGILSHNFAVRGGYAVTLLFGLGIFLGLVLLCVSHALCVLKDGVNHRPGNAVIFSLSAFSLLYCGNIVLGRTALGWYDVAITSRYITLLIPLGLAILLQIGTCRDLRLARSLSVGFALWISYGAIALNTREWKEVAHFHNGQAAWRAAYLSSHDETSANSAAHFKVYPTPHVITDRLRYLQDHQLNLFSGE